MLFRSNVCRTHFRTTFTVDACRHYAASITSALTAREKSMQTYVLQCFTVAQDTHWRRRAGFCSDKYSLISEESVAHLSKLPKAFL